MILSVLVKNEMIKMFKRLAFWVTFLSFSAILALNFGENYFRARDDPERFFALPAAWSDVLADDTELALIFGSVILILLISSEFSWRTARQNVIDGLSKEQFFIAKLILLPSVGLLFIGMQVLVGGGFALLGTDLSAMSEPFFRGVDLSVGIGVALAFIGYGALALFVSLAIRNSGPAMAMWFFYVAFLEQLLAQGLVALSDALLPIVRFLPVNTFNQLHRYVQHDPAAFRQSVERAVEAGRAAPEVWDMSTLVLVSVGWIGVFVAGSFFWFRRRDL